MGGLCVRGYALGFNNETISGAELNDLHGFAIRRKKKLFFKKGIMEIFGRRMYSLYM